MDPPRTPVHMSAMLGICDTADTVHSMLGLCGDSARWLWRQRCSWRDDICAHDSGCGWVRIMWTLLGLLVTCLQCWAPATPLALSTACWDYVATVRSGCGVGDAAGEVISVCMTPGVGGCGSCGPSLDCWSHVCNAGHLRHRWHCPQHAGTMWRQCAVAVASAMQLAR